MENHRITLRDVITGISWSPVEHCDRCGKDIEGIVYKKHKIDGPDDLDEWTLCEDCIKKFLYIPSEDTNVIFLEDIKETVNALLGCVIKNLAPKSPEWEEIDPYINEGCNILHKIDKIIKNNLGE